MTFHTPPVAFVGWAWDKDDGFIVKVCPLCPDHQRVKREAKGTKTRKQLCSLHHNQQLAARMGERFE